MAKTKSSAKGSKAAAPAKRAAPKPAAKPAPKAAAARKQTATDTKMDWSSTIKKALQDKGGQPQWPGSGDAWKRKNKI